MDEEYQSLRNQRAAAQREANSCSSQIGDYDYYIQRLTPVKATLEEEKARLKRLISADEAFLSKKRSWEGNRYNDYVRAMDAAGIENNAYLKNLDAALDSVNTKLTNLKNARDKASRRFSALTRTIRSLSTKIENFFN